MDHRVICQNEKRLTGNGNNINVPCDEINAPHIKTDYCLYMLIDSNCDWNDNGSD